MPKFYNTTTFDALSEQNRAAVNAYTAIWDAIKLPDFTTPDHLAAVRKQLANETERWDDAPGTPILNASNALLRAYVAYLDALIVGELAAAGPSIVYPRDSALVQRIEYERGRLVVSLAGGRAYTYVGVPLDVYDSFVDAPSKGRFFNDYIKGYYERV